MTLVCKLIGHVFLYNVTYYDDDCMEWLETGPSNYCQRCGTPRVRKPA